MRLAAGWYIAAVAKNIPPGAPLPLELFGRPLVAWRSAEGRVVLMERYCPHRGASLAAGRLVGGQLECPFHGWRFDGEGRCAQAPCLPQPPEARAQVLPTLERYGYVWAWHGGLTPAYPLPEFPPAEAERSDHLPVRFSYRTSTTALRVLENVYDAEHLVSVHDFQRAEATWPTELADVDWARATRLPPEATFRAEVEFVPATRAARTLRMHMGAFRLQVLSWPSGHLVGVQPKVPGGFASRSLHGVTAVRPGLTIGHTLLMIRRSGNSLRDLITWAVVGLGSIASTYDDLPVWNALAPEAGGAFVATDRAVLKFRSFHQQWIPSEQELPLAS